MKVAILLADGFEEIEAITPKDVIERAGIKCDFISIMEEAVVTGAHNIKILADDFFDEINLMNYDMIVLPGGMGGAARLAEDNRVIDLIRKFDAMNKKVAAICAAPALVISKSGISKNKRITSYPGMDEFIKDGVYVEERVCVDGNLITSRGPCTAIEFAYKLVEELGIDSNGLKKGMLY